MNRKRQSATRRRKAPGGKVPTAPAPPSLPLDAATVAYLTRLAEALTELGSAQQAWTLQHERLNQDAALLEDAGWRAGAQQTMNAIVTAAANLQIAPLPERAAPIGELMQEVSGHAQAMQADYAAALLQGDAAAMRSLKNHSAKIFTCIRRAQKLVPR